MSTRQTPGAQGARPEPPASRGEPEQQGSGLVALRAFLSRARAAAAKAAQGLDGTSSLGAYLAEDAVDGAAVAVYSPRTLSDHREKEKRTISVRIMGAEGPAGHEVWLTVWCREASAAIAAAEGSAQSSGWEALGEVSGKRSLVRGQVELLADADSGTVSLVRKERRGKPFTASEFAERLDGLFAEMERLLSGASAAAGPASPREGSAPSSASRSPDKREAAAGLASLLALGAGGVYDGPEELLAALESGTASPAGERLRLKLAGCEAELGVVDSPKGKRIELDLTVPNPPAAGALAWCRGELGDPSFSVRSLGDRSFSIRRTTRSDPALADLRQALDYAAKFVEKLGQAPSAGLPRRGEIQVRASIAPPEGAPVLDSAAAAPVPEELPSPEDARASGDIVEEEEISLEDLLSGPAGAETSPSSAPTESAEAELEAAAVPPGASAGPSPPAVPSSRPDVAAGRATIQAASPGYPASRPMPVPVAPVAAGVPPRQAAEREPVPQTLFGKVQAVERIGRDVLGVLYRAQDTSSGATVTLKVLDREHTLDPVFARRFVRETWPAAKLSHPGLKRVLSSGHTKDQLYYYVSEYVEGSSAREIVESGRGFAPAEAVRIAIALAEALEHAHSKGVFHGDVRPSLVLVTPEGRVLLAETGVARDIWGAIDRLLSRQGWSISDARKKREALEALDAVVRERSVSLWFLAPDLAAPRAVPDARVDVYGLGATLYFMVTGRVPFEGASALELLLGGQGVATPAHEVNTRVPRELGLVIQKMMAPGAAERYQSMQELLAALRELRFPTSSEG